MSDAGKVFVAAAGGAIALLVFLGKKNIKESTDPKPCVVEGHVVSRQTGKVIKHRLNVLVYDSSSPRPRVVYDRRRPRGSDEAPRGSSSGLVTIHGGADEAERAAAQVVAGLRVRVDRRSTIVAVASST